MYRPGGVVQVLKSASLALSSSPSAIIKKKKKKRQKVCLEDVKCKFINSKKLKKSSIKKKIIFLISMSDLVSKSMAFLVP
jgi:hypothetical protein